MDRETPEGITELSQPQVDFVGDLHRIQQLKVKDSLVDTLGELPDEVTVQRLIEKSSLASADIADSILISLIPLDKLPMSKEKFVLMTRVEDMGLKYFAAYLRALCEEESETLKALRNQGHSLAGQVTEFFKLLSRNEQSSSLNDLLDLGKNIFTALSERSLPQYQQAAAIAIELAAELKKKNVSGVLVHMNRLKGLHHRTGPFLELITSDLVNCAYLESLSAVHPEKGKSFDPIRMIAKFASLRTKVAMGKLLHEFSGEWWSRLQLAEDEDRAAGDFYSGPWMEMVDHCLTHNLSIHLKAILLKADDETAADMDRYIARQFRISVHNLSSKVLAARAKKDAYEVIKTRLAWKMDNIATDSGFR